jgi:hypothetical protein
MPKAPSVPSGVVTRAEAAKILGVSLKRVTNMRWQGQLEPVTTPHRKIGVFDRAQVESPRSIARGATPRSGAAPRTAAGDRAARPTA